MQKKNLTADYAIIFSPVIQLIKTLARTPANQQGNIHQMQYLQGANG